MIHARSEAGLEESDKNQKVAKLQGPKRVLKVETDIDGTRRAWEDISHPKRPTWSRPPTRPTVPADQLANFNPTALPPSNILIASAADHFANFNPTPPPPPTVPITVSSARSVQTSKSPNLTSRSRLTSSVLPRD
jgi:hypothetical protein